MTSYALAAALLCGAAGWDSGSLVVLEHSNKPVSRFTGSAITHVALLMEIGGNSWIYEATPGKVRRVPLETYRSELGELNERRSKKTKLWIMEPENELSRDQVLRMKAFLDSQVGRRYSVRGYVRGKRSDGVHCSEFASLALSHTGRHRFRENHSISPAALVKKLLPTSQRPIQLTLKARPTQASWCTRTWRRWCHFQLWCSWVCHEAWTWCW